STHEVGLIEFFLYTKLIVLKFNAQIFSLRNI
ncbi:MAG: hypothetical protein ACJAS1_003778, partial [Oleiphilaceae bacterium]